MDANNKIRIVLADDQLSAKDYDTLSTLNLT
jgi:hypothetical protein